MHEAIEDIVVYEDGTSMESITPLRDLLIGRMERDIPIKNISFERMPRESFELEPFITGELRNVPAPPKPLIPTWPREGSAYRWEP